MKQTRFDTFMMILATILMLCLLPGLPVLGAAGAEPLIGFVCHYPFIDVGMDQLPKTGATLVVRAVSGMEEKEGQFDPWPLQRQLDYAQKHDLKLVLLIEANPVYSPKWLTEKCKARGECAVSPWGTAQDTPSMSSPTYRTWQEGFTKRVVGWVKEHDLDHRIVAYQPGAEWWYPSNTRNSPLDVAHFRKWLQAKYGSMERLNRIWKASYKSFEHVQAVPIIASLATREDGLIDFTLPYHDCSWSTRQADAVRVEPGKSYIFSARVKIKDVSGDGAHLAVAYLSGESDVPKSNVMSRYARGTKDWQTLTLKIKPSPGITRAWLLLKLQGFGRCWFDDISFKEEGTSKNLAPNPHMQEGSGKPAKWYFDNWTNSKNVIGTWTKSKDEKCVSIAADASEQLITYKNVSAANYDWSRWSCEYHADYMNWFAGLCKKMDPSRPTMGYLTYSFANPVEWDYAQANAVSLDAILPRCKNLDWIGMQICSADGDPIRILATIDQARKYRKPVYAVDVIDFTSGTHIGMETLDRITQQILKRGASGLFYYCWHGTPDYNYYPDLGTQSLAKMVLRAKETAQKMHGQSIKADIALVQPVLPYCFGDRGGLRNYFRDYMGIYKALFEAGYMVDVWTLEELASVRPDLSRYKAVVLPDCLYVKSDALKVLGSYVRSGGKLVRSGRPPELDEYGRPVVLQAAIKTGRTMGASFGSDYLGEIIRTTHAGNTPPLFMDVEDKEKLREKRKRMLLTLKKALQGTRNTGDP